MRRSLRRIYKAANAQRAHTPSVAPPVVISISPSTGSPNVDTNVTITGTDFSADAAVDIGTTGSSPAGSNQFSGFVFVNSTTITGTVSASPGGASNFSYDVAVTNSGGTSTLHDGFTIPLAGIDSITPSSGTHLGGTAIAVAGWGFVDQTASDIKLGGVSTTLDVFTDDNNATAVTGAHAAVAVTAIIVCDAGSLQSNGNRFTYT